MNQSEDGDPEHVTEHHRMAVRLWIKPERATNSLDRKMVPKVRPGNNDVTLFIRTVSQWFF